MYPIPLRASPSHAVLTPPAVCALFGEGYELSGTERVEVVALGRTVTTVEARAGTPLHLLLDAIDREALPREVPLRLVGPKGALPLEAPAEALASVLVLPPGLLTAWRLVPGRLVAVAVGRVVLTDVPVSMGTTVHLKADRAVLLAGGIAPGGTACWLPDFALASPTRRGTNEAISVPSRVVTENDVRQARRRRETLQVLPGQIVTPAAQSLGRALGVLRDEPGGH